MPVPSARADGTARAWSRKAAHIAAEGDPMAVPGCDRVDATLRHARARTMMTRGLAVLGSLGMGPGVRR